MLQEDGPVRVIGIGNEFRQDDGVGLAVVRRVMSRAAGRIDVIEHDGEGTSLLDTWEGARTVILVDAVRSGWPAGTIHCVDLRATGFPGGTIWSSSHSLGVTHALTLAAILDRLPHALLIYGIEGRCFGFGTGLSPEVAGAAFVVVERLLSRVWRS